MSRYAQNTTVSPDKTMIDIQQTLRRYGASKFGMTEDGKVLQLGFEMKDRRFRFAVPLPAVDADQFKLTRINQFGSRASTLKERTTAREKAIAQRWRALLLVIKAKLEAVESGIETLEQAFMAQLVLADGQTMSEWVEPQAELIYGGKQMPPLLGSGL